MVKLRFVFVFLCIAGIIPCIFFLQSSSCCIWVWGTGPNIADSMTLCWSQLGPNTMLRKAVAAPLLLHVKPWKTYRLIIILLKIYVANEEVMHNVTVSKDDKYHVNTGQLLLVLLHKLTTKYARNLLLHTSRWLYKHAMFQNHWWPHLVLLLSPFYYNFSHWR